MIEGGYILLARKMFESNIMDKPPHYLKLWVWMLGKAFWKNGDKLQRGQFFTTIKEMQKAGCYKVGYRTRELTKGEVRSAYEDFTKNTMISTMKSTRGMVITICNYDVYQNPNNYEEHNEHSTKTPRRTRAQHTIDEEGLKERKEKPLCAFDEFWKAYPKKKSKGQAEKAWGKITQPSETLRLILDALKWQKASQEWTKENGQYIPYPASYLNAKGWEDEQSQPQLELIPALRGTN